VCGGGGFVEIILLVASPPYTPHPPPSRARVPPKHALRSSLAFQGPDW
jgi:hypothetical protein